MSVKLVKKDRMKSYQIQVYLSKYRKYKWVNTYCSNKKDAQSILKQYQKADIEYKLGLRESQLPDMEQPTIRDAVDSYLTSVENSIQSKGTYKLKKFVLNEFVERVNEVKIRRGFGAEYVTEQITNYLSKNTAIQQMSRVGSRFKNTVQSFAKRLEPIINRLGGTQGLAKGGFWGLAFKLMEDMFNIKIDDNAGQGVAMANGGLITEPIMGVGQRTGKSYLMGEAGNEYVVPQNKMNTGVNLTINIQNMSGNREDINKLRDVVLRVMQESSSKMVR